MTSSLLWTLIALQVAMGAFDTLYHHELTERLPWRPSQRKELALHAVRNGLYAALFLVLGFLEVHGIWALLVIAVLAAEVVITLIDFVEEDLTRKLPASERVNHTLLALNYGAILTLLLPILIGWSAQPTAVIVTHYGYWSVLAALAALGVVLFGLRDMAAAQRARRLVRGDAAHLVASLAGRRHVLVTGATGFIGRRLVEALVAAGHQVTLLARDPAKAASLRPPFVLVTDLAQIPGDARVDAIVNLAGEPLANGLWTRAKRFRIVASRLRMARAILRLIERLERRPSVLITASAVGWYGLWNDEELTEFDGGKRSSFSHRTCDMVERTAKRVERLGVRTIRLRIGLVLGTDGGLLASMLTPFEFGIGGRIGSGRQWMSWIERDDLVRLIAHAIVTPELTGAVNATAPAPVRNSVFAAELGRGLRRPAILPMPAAILSRLGGDLADELLLGGQRVLPDKAVGSGFVFRHPTLRSALASMLSEDPCRESEAVRGSRSPPPPAKAAAVTPAPARPTA